MPILMAGGLIALSVIALVYAAKWLVDGLIGAAAQLAVPTFILSMLVISIDLEVFAPVVIGSAQDLTALSYGAVLGTVIFLIALALGSAALVYPIQKVDFPWRYGVVLGALLLLHLMIGGDGVISGGEGMLLIALYALYMLVLITDLRRAQSAQAEIEEASAEVREMVGKPARVYALYIGGGLVGLVVGGLLAVLGVGALLNILGLTETILGVTLLAITANAVELVEAIIPAQRGLPEVVVGNVIGSAVFQLLFTTGIAALLRPLSVEPIVQTLIMPVTLIAWLCLMLVIVRGRASRRTGGLLILVYVIFVALTILLDSAARLA